jgi:hypothetical protein
MVCHRLKSIPPPPLTRLSIHVDKEGTWKEVTIASSQTLETLYINGDESFENTQLVVVDLHPPTIAQSSRVQTMHMLLRRVSWDYFNPVRR